VDTEMCCPKGKCGCQYFILHVFTLKKMPTDVFEIRLGQNVNMYTNRLCRLLRNGFVSVNTTDRIIIDHYIAI
jgi:hypothetical protein